MPKRGAEEQITKDDGSDSERGSPVIEGERTVPLPPVEGRKIRGLPKRSGGGGASAIAPTPTASTATPAASVFAGFSFGQPTATSSNPLAASTKPTPPGGPFAGLSFSFAVNNGSPAVPAVQAISSTTSATPFGFGSRSEVTQPAAPAPLPAAPRPAVNLSFGSMTSQSNPPASFFGQKATPLGLAGSYGTGLAVQPVPALGFGNPSVHPTAATASFAVPETGLKDFGRSTSTPANQELLPSQPTPPPEEEVSYYLSTRGLNLAFLAFLTQTLNSDPFADLSQTLPGLLQQYEQRLNEEARKAGWRPAHSVRAATEGSISQNNGFESAKPLPAPVASTPTTPAAPQMPAPPLAGTFRLPAASYPGGSSTGGFVPTAPSSGPTSSPFTFGSFGVNPSSSSTSTNATTKKHSDTVTKLVENVLAGDSEAATGLEDQSSTSNPTFSFGVGSSLNPSVETKKPSSLFSFGPTGPLKPATPDSKTFTPSATIDDATPPAKLGKFGPGGSQPQLAFGGAKPASSATSTSPAAAAKPFAFGFGSNAAAVAPSFGFGNSTQPITTQSTETTTPSTTPVSFAAPPNDAGPARPAAPSFAFNNPSVPASGSSSFVFKPLAATTSAADSLASESGSADASGAPTPDQGSPSKNLAALVGEGEEDEVTVTEQTAKLYMSVDGALKAIGVGSFKLKRGKDSGERGPRKRRLLMRVDGSGNILLNMKLLESFSPVAEGSTIRFVGFDLKGQPGTTALRLRNDDLAADMVKMLVAEVDEMKKET